MIKNVNLEDVKMYKNSDGVLFAIEIGEDMYFINKPEQQQTKKTITQDEAFAFVLADIKAKLKI